MGKTVLGRTIPVMREMDRGRTPWDQLRTQDTADEFSEHVSQSLPDLSREQKEWHKTVVETACEHLSYALIRLGSTPDVVCSGVSQPDKDFIGRMLLDLRKPGVRQDDVAFGLVPAETRGFAFFGWLGHFAEAEEFVGHPDPTKIHFRSLFLREVDGRRRLASVHDLHALQPQNAGTPSFVFPKWTSSATITMPLL